MADSAVAVLALVPEIMTMVRIQAALTDGGWVFRTTETQPAFLAELNESRPAVAVVDLGQEELDIQGLADHCRRAGVRLIAFGRHTDTARLRAAKEAGADAVYPRGKFLEDPDAALRAVLAGSPRRG
jgi:DNA-binding NarL/FixJ family response regulator